MANKSFQQYQGEQVNQIPAGFVEAMGSMGQAYASIGQNIAQGMQMYKKSQDETAIAKAQVSPYISKNTAEINGFKSSGFLDTDSEGNVKIAEGKQSMFEGSKLGELQSKIDLYNSTKGGTADLSSAEYQGLAARVKTESEAAKADRDERLVAAKEGQVIADKLSVRQKEEAERRKTQLDAWKEVNKSMTDLAARHALERKQELLGGPVNADNERRRRAEMDDLRSLRIEYKPDFGTNPTGKTAGYYNEDNGFNTGGVVPVAYVPKEPVGAPEGSTYVTGDVKGTSWSQSAAPKNPFRTRGDFSVLNAVAPDLSRYASQPAPGLETSAKPSQAPAAPAAATTAAPATPAAPARAPIDQGPAPIAPISIPASGVEAPEGQIARNNGNAVYKSSTSNKLNYAGSYDVLTTSRGDIRRVAISTESDFLTVGMKKTDPYAVTVDESGHPTIVMNGRMDSADAKDATNMAGMALRFLAEGRVSNFSITDAQKAAVESLPIPDSSTAIEPMLWRRALVAAGIAVGRVQPAAGQNINQLTYGDMFKVPEFRSVGQIAAGENAAASNSFNVQTTRVPTGTPLTNRTGATLEVASPVRMGNVQIIGVLPSMAARKRFQDAGIPIEADDERTFDSMDAQAKFANDMLAQQALIAEREFKANEARAAAGTSVSNRVSVNTNIAANFGEKVKRYPGAQQPTGDQFGHFNVPMPFKGPTARYTSADITRVMEDFNSPDPAVADKAGRDLTLMTSRLSAGGVSEVQLNKASEATMLFNESIGAIAELNYANQKVSALSWVDDILTRMNIGPIQKDLKAAEIRAMFLRGSIRPIIAGPGNPAVYEQEMINATIPNLQAFTSIRSWDKSRIQALALVTASGYIERMRQNGFTEVTQESVDNINLKLKAAYGDKAPEFKIEDLSGSNSWMSVQTSPERRDAWLKAKGIPTVAQLKMSNKAANWEFDGSYAPTRLPQSQ